LHSKLGSGHLPHGGQGWHFFASAFAGHVGHAGQAGQTGGTISDFKIYKSSDPGGIWLAGTPGGREF